MIAHSGTRVFRLDLASGAVVSRKRTPQGGLIAAANLTRTGVFPYRQADGSVRRELRSPEEVFAPDSLATYALAPVTVDHPGKVGPANWKTHSVGIVGPDVRKDGDYVAGEVHIQHADTIGRAESGDLKELSCGYSCEVDRSPGTYKGQPYDAIQRNIRINHVALLPSGQGRMGPGASIHLDAGEAISGEPETARAALAAQWASSSEKRLAAEDAKRSTDEYEATSQIYRLNRAADELIAARADAIALFGSTWSADGKSIESIWREVVAARHPEELERIARLDEQARAPTLRAMAAICLAHRGESPVHRADSDESDEPDAEGARKAHAKRIRDAWKTPKKERGGSRTDPPAREPESESEEESGGEKELGDGAMARAARAASDARRLGGSR